ncbi:signal peptidase I [Salinibacterium sp. dk2585]|uniref:signal peptidase I n=1 Tax=unclassified Salinibacterium TaxID=2632331 RepID=UPI0011C25092|nr:MULTISPECIES: signal peptidase I [unclassified Salinibacterium]QEE61571.1 signal peptidase I [Salinibacterium sp. dk2585]TXK52460.1 signal peptidase I [Salinibacterium sp. dk5596]
MTGKRAQTDEATPRGILYSLGVGASAGLLAFVVLLGLLVIVVPMAVGATPLTVLTSSMEPKLPPGTLVIVRPVDPMQVKVGDVITYQIESGKEGVVTHRVTGIINSSDGTRTFTTKGDNNDVEDAAPVLPVQVQGELWYSVPWIGYVNNLVNGANRAWIVPTIAIGLFLYAGYMIASGIAGAVKKRRSSTAAVEGSTRSAGDVEHERVGDAHQV